MWGARPSASSIASALLTTALLATAVVVTPVGAAAADPPLEARGSVNQVLVRGAAPGATLELRQGGGAPLQTATADAQGAVVFGGAPEPTDDVARGSGYTVTEVGGDTVGVQAPDWSPATAPAEVLGPEDHPPQAFYDAQVIPAPANSSDLVSTDDDGYGYLTTRDGTTLSVNVLAPFTFFPQPTYPTIVVYSGYTPSAPDIQGDPDDGVTTLLRVAGYAVVSVNIRGTGCSGGVYSYFEPLQGLDGYDVIETVAAQPWVASAAPDPRFDPDGGPKIGMAGISFGGISQLFVARTRPPSLAAITPLSVIADTYRSTLYPGGILNDGFAQGWAAEREESARPAGQSWAADRIAGGDTTCADNQAYKDSAPPLVARFDPDLLYQAEPGDALAPETFVDEIEAPTFIAGSFQDEQTGGHWATMLDAFDTPTEEAAGTDELKRAVLFNGTHADALGPDTLRDLLEFFDLYVHRLTPRPLPVLRGDVASAMASVFGGPYVLAPNRAAEVPDQRAYEAEDDVVVRWERGARDSTFCRVDADASITVEDPAPCVPDGQGDGAPFGRFETTHASWPPPDRTARRWFLRPDGALRPTRAPVADGSPRGASSFAYRTDPGRTQDRTDDGSGPWDKDTTYDWVPAPDPDRLRFESPPLAATQVYAGSGSATLFLRSSAADVDLEVLLTEVRPDGQEVLIQSGWLRASHRQEAPGSTALDPRHTHVAPEPLPPDRFSRVRVALFPFAHVVREGSRVALTVSAPGGNRSAWTFGSPADDGATVNHIAHSVGRRSVLTLPEVTASLAPTPALPASAPVCGDLRSQPCRTAPEGARPTAVTAAVDAAGRGTDLDRGIDVAWTAPVTAGVTAYEVGAVPGGPPVVDADTSPALRVPVPVGETPPPGDPAFTVTASYPLVTAGPSTPSNPVLRRHPYRDVPARAAYRPSLDWASTWRVVGGLGGRFSSTTAVTRAQFVRWLWNLHGRPSGAPAHGFADVGAGSRLSPALSWARDAGIVNRFPGNRFKPNAAITRGHAIRWLWEADGAPTGLAAHPYRDVGTTGKVARALDWAKADGVLGGGGRFRPQRALNRGPAVIWLEGLARATTP